MSTFRVEIELGNAAMEQPEHVADALEEIAGLLRREPTFNDGGIRDANGNTVGSYGCADDD